MMDKKNVLTKVCVYSGLVLVWFTLLAPFLLAIVYYIYAGEFLFEHLCAFVRSY